MGSIPATIEKLRNLVFLQLRQSDLLGPIPPSLGYCKMHHTLTLADNKLSGSLPPTFRFQEAGVGEYFFSGNLIKCTNAIESVCTNPLVCQTSDFQISEASGTSTSRPYYSLRMTTTSTTGTHRAVPIAPKARTYDLILHGHSPWAHFSQPKPACMSWRLIFEKSSFQMIQFTTPHPSLIFRMTQESHF